MNNSFTRRRWLATAGAAALGSRVNVAAAPDKAALDKSGSEKPMQGAFMILSTPYTSSKAVDYEDLAREVDFLDRCGVQGLVWPQNASEQSRLTKDERMRGMEVLAKAARGRKPALVLGVQGTDTRATKYRLARFWPRITGIYGRFPSPPPCSTRIRCSWRGILTCPDCGGEMVGVVRLVQGSGWYAQPVVWMLALARLQNLVDKRRRFRIA